MLILLLLALAAAYVVKRRLRRASASPFEFSDVEVRAVIDERRHEIVRVPDAPTNLVVTRVVDPNSDDYESYDHLLYEFSDPTTRYVARSFLSDPENVHFLGKVASDGGGVLVRRDLRSQTLREAINWLRRTGKTVDWLSQRGYKRA